MPDVLILSRLQFALTVMFHYLFPPLTIGLGLLMVFMEGMYLKTRDPQYEAMAKFWTRIFGVNFAMGVASGIVMEFQFGTNWATYSRYVGDVFGSALAAEGIFAFFLESGFLAVLIFGWDRVSPRMHFFSTLMVALGSMFSAIWIVVANSWQQTPAGFHIVGEGLSARAEITDFWAMVFNPSSMHRLGHVILGAWILGAFFVMSISAWYLLKKRFEAFARKSFTIALGLAAVSSVLIAVSGHFQADKVAETQPPKLAAFEGIFETSSEGTPLILFGLPNEKEQRMDAVVAVPGLLSWLVYGNMATPVAGLDRVPADERPPVAITFYTYRLMVALGVYFLVLSFYSLWALYKGRLFQNRPLLWVWVFSVVGPFIANQVGWIAAEVGRQPWVVYGLLRTSDALSKVVRAEQVLGSIIMFIVIYSLLFAVWVYVLNKKIQHGPDDDGSGEPRRSDAGLLEAAGALIGKSGSMTDAQDKGGACA